MSEGKDPRALVYAPWLWALTALFLLRVVGQILVAFLGVTFLPPMEEWYSGLISYPYLLASQILILMLQGKICLDFSRAEGLFVRPRRGLGTGALIFGCVYLGAMILRYVLRMALYPEERWFGGTIPIVFHWVLAAYVILVGTYHRKRALRPPAWRGGDAT